MEKALKQCKACPWKKSTKASVDIPGGYCSKKHRALKNTMVDGIASGPIRAMACHETPVGRERMCVGWAANQLGPGNNIMLRMRALSDRRLLNLKLDGEQHLTLDDTIT